MAATERLICAADQLTDGAGGVRFTVMRDGEREPAFVVRFGGQVYAYLNACAHVPVELDWNAGDFFDLERRHLICATHGARYEPQTGYCVMGPCKGARLTRLEVVEHDGGVWLLEAG